MKCQRCEKPATFHITELTGPQPQEHHLCETCFKAHFVQAEEEPAAAAEASLAGMLAKQLKLGQAAEQLQELDKRSCPQCGITFFEFRNQGRLGCPHDYVHFRKELLPLIANIHGEVRHVGKRPAGSAAKGTDTDWQTVLIRLRRELKEATSKEAYERAAELRDEIRDIERKLRQEDEPPPAQP
jgi:protein arginine kinase activator